MKPLPAKLDAKPVWPPRDIEDMLARHIMLPGHQLDAARVYRHETVDDFLGRVGWEFVLPTICVINGEPVLRKEWSKRKIKFTDRVCFVSKPWGKGSGTGKQILGLIAIIALSALAPGIGSAIATGLGLPATILGVSTGALIGAGITLGGALLVNALVKPKPGGQNDTAAFDNPDPIYSVSASGNVGKPLQPIPVGYGKLKSFPDFAATPWSEFLGNDQYLNVLLTLGCGKYRIHQLFIDDTILWDENTGFNPDFTGITKEFYDPGQTVTLFPANITQSVEVSGQELPDPALPPTPGWIGGFIANASGTTIKSLAVDIVFPSGCYTVDTSTGNLQSQSVQIIAEARAVNDAGAPITSFTQIVSQTLTFATRTPQRVSFKVEVPEGRYEVRVRRVSAPLSGTNGIDTVYWAGLRGFLVGPSSFPGVTTVALRILANAQLNANSAKKFGVLATRILPVWNGTEWVDTPTQNPFWAFYDAATNSEYGAKRPSSKIDFQAIVDGAAAADARGDTFNFSFTQVSSIPEAFDTILKSSRARHRWSGDILSCVRDEWRAVPEMLLTDREIIRGSLSVDWLFNTDDSADAVVLEYLDEATWGAAEVQYPPDSEDFTATQPARVRLDGVTNRDHAYRECAFIYRQSQLRRTNVNLDTEHDGRRLAFGSSVRVQSELPWTWGSTGVVVSRAGDSLTLDPAPDWSEVGQHYIAVRDKRGRLFGPVKCARGATDAIALLDHTDLATVEGAGKTLDDALERGDGADDPSFAFGLSSSWAKPCVVISGRPNGDTVSLSLFVDDASVHSSDIGSTPLVPTLPALTDSAAPQIDGLTANFRQGVAEPVLDASWWRAPGAFYYLAEVSYDGGLSWTPIYEGTSNVLSKTVDLAALRLRVAAVGTRRGSWRSVDVAAPTIEINTRFFPSDVNAALAFVSEQLAKNAQQLDDISRLVASVATEQDAHNYLDKWNEKTRSFAMREYLNGVINEVDTRLSSELGIANAAITTNASTIAALNASFASYQTAVAAQFAGVTSSVTTNQTAIASLQDSFSSYQTTVAAQFTVLSNQVDANSGAIATLQSAVSTNATAIADLDGSFASYQLSVESRFASTDASIAANTASIQQNASSLATLNSSLATYQNTVTSTLNNQQAQISQSATSLTNLSNSFASYQTTVSSQFSSMQSSLQSQITTNANAVSSLSSAFSSYQTTVSASLSSLTTSVSTNATAIATIGGKLASQWTLTLDTNGYVSGIKAYNDGTVAGTTFIGDIFQVAFPNSAGGVPTPVFGISNVGGVAKVALLGDMIADGSIDAQKLNVNFLTAISAAFGNATVSGQIVSQNGKMVIDFDNNQMVFSD